MRLHDCAVDCLRAPISLTRCISHGRPLANIHWVGTSLVGWSNKTGIFQPRRRTFRNLLGSFFRWEPHVGKRVGTHSTHSRKFRQVPGSVYAQGLRRLTRKINKRPPLYRKGFLADENESCSFCYCPVLLLRAIRSPPEEETKQVFETLGHFSEALDSVKSLGK